MILGAEILLSPIMTERLKENQSLIFRGEKQYVLIEFPFSQLPIYAEEVFYRLLTENIIYVIAHPERYLYLRKKDHILSGWIENGVMCQLNTGSLNGKYGEKIKRFSKSTLKKGFIHFLGSDVHSVKDDYLPMSAAFRLASKYAGIKNGLRDTL